MKRFVAILAASVLGFAGVAAGYIVGFPVNLEKLTADADFVFNGQVPAFTAFNILFKFLQSQPVDAVRAGKFDRYLDAIEKGYVTGSSEPRDIYAFYLQRGMTERAKIYRAAANKAASYDLDYFFNMVDQSPSTYTR